MKHISILLCIAVTAALAGCGTTEPLIDVRYKNVLVEPSDELIQDCKVAEPPDRAEYIAANSEKREEMLTKAFAAATTAASSCNKRMKGLRDWKIEQRKLLETPEAVPTGNK